MGVDSRSVVGNLGWMVYELTGTIKQTGEVQTFASGFSKREIVITTEGDRFPQDIALEALKEKMEILDGFSAGDRVKAFFDIRGREYKGRHFVNLVVWKLEKLDGSTPAIEESEESLEGDEGPDEEVPF